MACSCGGRRCLRCAERIGASNVHVKIFGKSSRQKFSPRGRAGHSRGRCVFAIHVFVSTEFYYDQSSQYPVQHPLVKVVLPRAPRVYAVRDHRQHDLHALLLRLPEVKPLPEVVQNLRPSLKARRPGRGHHLHEKQYALRVPSEREVALDAQDLVVVKRLRRDAGVVAVHHLQVLPGELERARLEVDPARGRAQHEVKVDVYQVPVVRE